MSSVKKKWLAISAAAMIGLACGPTKTPDKGNGSTNTPPVGEPIKDPTPTPKPEEKPLAAIWQQVPSSAFMAVAMHHPTKSAGALRDALSKMGVFAEFYKEADFDDFQEEFGFDFFDAEAAKKFGVDDARGIAMVFDAALLFESHWFQEYSATIDNQKNAASYAIIPVSDAATFTSMIKAAATKKNTEVTFEEESDGGVSYVYLMRPSMSNYPPAEAPTPTPTPAPTPAPAAAKELTGIIAIKNNTAYFFDHTVSPASTKDMPDYIAEFKKNVKAYLATATSSSIATTDNFKTVAKKLNPAGDCLMYMDSGRALEADALNLKRDVTYLTPKDDNQRQAQEEQKRYAADDSWRQRDHAYLTQLATQFPAWGMSAELKKDGAVCEGYMMLGSSAQAGFSTLMTLPTEPPAYGTMFPEDTTFVYRESINFAALKSVIEMFIEERDREDFKRGYEEMKSGAQTSVGLDLEKDIIGAFTGHIAFGAPDLSILIMPLFLGRSTYSPPPVERAPAPMPMPMIEVKPIDPALPQDIPAGTAPRLMAPMPPPKPAMQFPTVIAIAQLTSAAAGDKLVEAMLKVVPMIGLQLKTEESGGVKFYSMDIDGVTLACARVDSYMVFSTNIEKMKQTIERIQKPGASFVDKLPTAMSKALVTDKSVSGCTGNVGGVFSWILKQPDMHLSADDISMMAKLSTGLGTSTMKISYEDNGLACKGELTLP